MLTTSVIESLQKPKTTRLGQWFFWVLVVVLAGLFFLPPIENRTEAEDAFWYAREVEELTYRELAHPHHWLYHPAAKLFFELSGQERSFDSLVVLSNLCGIGALFLFYRLLRKVLDLDSWSSLAMTSCLAFSYGFWRYSREVEVYAMGWLFLLLSLSLLFWRKEKWWQAALFTASAIVAFNVHRALGVPILSAGLVYFAASKRWRGLGVVVVVFGALGLASEWAMPRIFSGEGERQGGEVWTPQNEGTKELLKARKEGRSLQISSLPKAAVGFGATLLSGNVVMSSDAVFSLLQEKIFKYRFLKEERMMVQGIGAFWLVFWVAGVVIVCSLLGNGFSQACRSGVSLSPELLATGAGFAAYAGMILIFEPGNPEMWLFVLPLFWLLVSFLTKTLCSKWRWSLWCGMYGCSLIGGIQWLGEPLRDYHLISSKLVRQEAKDGDVYLIGAHGSVHLRFVAYQKGVISPTIDPAAPDRRDRGWEQIEKFLKAGKRVFAHETFFVQADGKRVLPENLVRLTPSDKDGLKGSELVLKERVGSVR